MSGNRVFSLAEVAKHNTREDCWCIIHGEVYDLTKFLPEHPGGKAIILKYAGKDATKAFDPIHPKDIIQKLLPSEVKLGKLNPSELSNSENAVVHAFPPKNAPPMSTILNLFDFELIARYTMSPHAWAYYSSGSDDELTLRENIKAFHRIWLKPRVLVDVRNINLTTTILGYNTTLPFYITATALGKLGHPEGETVLTKAAHETGIIQMIPTLSSCSMDEIIDAKPSKDQTQFLQLYVNANRKITEKVIKRAEEGGVKAIFITVDAPELGRREKDMRMKSVESADLIDEEDKSVNKNQGAAKAISSFIDPSLSWDKLSWFRETTNLPLALKGIQCGEDAVLAAKYGMDAIVVSNHGGRQVDLCRSAIEVLPEVVEALDQYYYDNSIPKKKQMEIYVDGGIRRGSDIFKALALGAKAVGIGRPFLYAMSTYGQQGVEHAIKILRDELFTVMRLMGTTRIQDIHNGYLDTKFLSARMNTEDTWSKKIYEPISLPQFKVMKDSKL